MKLFAALVLAASLAFSPFVFTSGVQQDSENPSKSFQVKKGGNLVVDVEPGSVRIEPWSKDEVFIQAENIDVKYPDRLQMTQSGNTVILKYRDRRRNAEDIHFTINLPVEFSAKITTSGGRVEQRDILKGNFDLNTKGGNVDIEEIDGRVDIESGGGTIRGEKIDGDAKIKTGGGNVTIKTATGETEVESGGGGLRIDKVGRGLKLDTGGGSINVGNVGGEANVRSGGGSIRVGPTGQKIVVSTGGGAVEVLGASGASNVRTGGGAVSLENITGSIALKTGGGNVSVELKPNGTGNSSVYSGGGDIRLYIPENAKARVEATLKLRSGWGNERKRYKITSDFKSDKFDQDEDEGTSFAAYTVNGGGDKIELETTNGNIEIRKLKK